ncbi:uncharacterized protein LOC142332462 [Lycorma delicatula]|uniref:uncharacterized protein LOC142332462 n=1 Tax=Lycorma delicatula TaxID=130591 RepID=UPI003F51A42F
MTTTVLLCEANPEIMAGHRPDKVPNALNGGQRAGRMEAYSFEDTIASTSTATSHSVVTAAAASSATSSLPTSPPPSPVPTLSEREQIRIEFYKTYDVMTGVRIAATLGGFFGLMVLLVVYKSKCKSRSLSDEHLEAAVAAAVIEEEEELALNALNLYGPRRSLGNMSAPSINNYPRFSSLAGCSLMNPQMRPYYRPRARMSISGPASTATHRFSICQSPLSRPLTSLPPKRSYPEEEEDEEEDDDDYPCNFLRVPSSRRASRRLSSITCSSSDTSYLERRGSAVEVGLPPPPPHRRPRLDPHPNAWDFYYPIDIQVIQPTPEISPSGSEGSLYSNNINNSLPGGLLVPKMAPLASISSCGITDISDDAHSIGSDSVFLDDECLDTEDEAEDFSTDSDLDADFDERKKSLAAERFSNLTPSNVPFAEHLQVSQYPRTLAGRWQSNKPVLLIDRRYSSPSSQNLQRTSSYGDNSNLMIHDDVDDDSQFPTCSKSCYQFGDNLQNNSDNIANRPQLPLPQNSSSSDSGTLEITMEKQNLDTMDSSEQQSNENTTTINVNEQFNLIQSRPFYSASCDHLVKALQQQDKLKTASMQNVVENCSWSQETLF